MLLKKCILEQSVWFESIDLDKQDIPQYTILYTDNIDNKSHIYEEYNLIDYTYGRNRFILLSELLEANNKENFISLLQYASLCDSITIIDNLSIDNNELNFIKDFYIKAFCSRLSDYCNICMIFRK